MKYFVILILLFMSACSAEKQQVEQNGETMTAPDNYLSDSEVWGDTGDQVRIKGCEEWKQRDPEADC